MKSLVIASVMCLMVLSVGCDWKKGDDAQEAKTKTVTTVTVEDASGNTTQAWSGDIKVKRDEDVFILTNRTTDDQTYLRLDDGDRLTVVGTKIEVVPRTAAVAVQPEPTPEVAVKN